MYSRRQLSACYCPTPRACSEQNRGNMHRAALIVRWDLIINSYLCAAVDTSCFPTLTL